MSRETIYLLSKDDGGSAAPLVAALTDRVLLRAVRAAEDAGGRLDPPLLALLDEAANVCRIADLPQLYSHLGSRGVVPVTILQSYAQGEGMWGKGVRALWSAATVKLLGAGLDDAAFVEDVSRLVGDHDVATDSWSSGQGRASRTRSSRRERIPSAAQVRALAKGTALLLATGMRPALPRLQPRYAGPRAGQITQSTRRTVQRLPGRPRAPPSPARRRPWWRLAGRRRARRGAGGPGRPAGAAVGPGAGLLDMDELADSPDQLHFVSRACRNSMAALPARLLALEEARPSRGLRRRWQEPRVARRLGSAARPLGECLRVAYRPSPLTPGGP